MAKNRMHKVSAPKNKGKSTHCGNHLPEFSARKLLERLLAKCLHALKFLDISYYIMWQHKNA